MFIFRLLSGTYAAPLNRNDQDTLESPQKKTKRKKETGKMLSRRSMYACQHTSISQDVMGTDVAKAFVTIIKIEYS